jgi:hypothetical protein
MKKIGLLAGLLLLAALAAASPATARRTGVSGSFKLDAHAHSSEFGGPSGEETLFPTTPVPIPISPGDYSYSSIPCDKPAPFNDVSLSFSPDYPGMAEPASTRSLIEPTIVKVGRGGDHGRLAGGLTTIVCQSGDEMLFSFRGTFRQTSANEVRFHGHFHATGGTGAFEDLMGHGSIQGTFTCLPATLAHQGAQTCAELGVFSDSVFTLRGSYADPTVPTT